MAFFDVQQAVSGKQAKAFAIINGNIEELFYARSLEATMEKNKVDVPRLGKTNNAQKPSGWNGTGTLTIYYMTSLFRRLAIDYVKTGRDIYFDLQVINEDSNTNIGKQTVTLKECNLDSVVLARFDVTSDDPLEEEMPFTFHDCDMLEEFS